MDFTLKLNELFHKFVLLVKEEEWSFRQVRQDTEKTAGNNINRSSDIGQGLEGQREPENKTNKTVGQDQKCSFFGNKTIAFLFRADMRVPMGE